MAYITVDGAGMDDVNGTYKDIGNNIFELKSSIRNDTYYRILNDSNAYGKNCIILTQNRSNEDSITLYLSGESNLLSKDNNDLNKEWVNICGILPTPLFTKIEPKGSNKRDSKDTEFNEFFRKENELKKTLFSQLSEKKKKNKGKRKAKDNDTTVTTATEVTTIEDNNPQNVLYWSRKFNNWTEGIVSEINRNETTSDEYIFVESNLIQFINKSNVLHDHNHENKNENKEDDITVTVGNIAHGGLTSKNINNINELSIKEKEKFNFYEKIYIRIDSNLIRPLSTVRKHCNIRNINKNDCVRVWSRNKLKWLKGIATQFDQGYIFIDCQEPRWIQQDSCLIQSL